MNTNQVAQKWAEMCREGKNIECIEALYSDNITSKEMPGVPDEIVQGKLKVLNKSKEWLENVETFHSSEIGDPIIAGNHFTSKLNFDITFKDRGRQRTEEVAVFEVKDGKITNEQFFYDIN